MAAKGGEERGDVDAARGSRGFRGGGGETARTAGGEGVLAVTAAAAAASCLRGCCGGDRTPLRSCRSPASICCGGGDLLKGGEATTAFRSLLSFGDRGGEGFGVVLVTSATCALKAERRFDETDCTAEGDERGGSVGGGMGRAGKG